MAVSWAELVLEGVVGQLAGMATVVAPVRLVVPMVEMAVQVAETVEMASMVAAAEAEAEAAWVVLMVGAGAMVVLVVAAVEDRMAVLLEVDRICTECQSKSTLHRNHTR